MFAKITTLLVVGFVALSKAEGLFGMFQAAQEDNSAPLSMVKSLIQQNQVDGAQDLSSKNWAKDTNDVFKKCDSNKSGYLTKQEFISCGGNEAGWRQVQYFDGNRDGLMSWTEIYNAVKYYDNKVFSLSSNESAITNSTEDSTLDTLDQDNTFSKFRSFAAGLVGESLIDTKTRTQINQVYAQFDTNRDGKLSRAEIKSGATRMGEKINDAELNQAFQMIDTNRDGLISKAELINFIDTYQNKQINLVQTRTDKTNLIFKTYDTNKDGSLNIYEVQKMLTDALGYATQADARWFIKQLDTNYDGRLSWAEVYAALQ